jgi:hypothetical protein
MGTHSPSRFGRAAWLTLLFVLLLVGVSTAQLIYRYFLPTDGWAFIGGIDNELVYYANLVGAPSDLQPLDDVTGLEGKPMAEVMQPPTLWQGATPSFWFVGNSVSYEVMRGEERLEIAVPIVNWTPGAVIRYLLVFPWNLFSVIGNALLLLVGFIAFYRRPDDPAARALLIFVGVLTAMSITYLIPDGLSATLDPVALPLATFFGYLIYATLFAPSLLAFTLVFPRPKAIIDRHPWLAYSPYILGAFILAIMVIFGANIVGWIGTMLIMALCIASLIHSALTMRDAVSRAQLLWAFGGLILGIGLFMFNFPSAFGWVPGLESLFSVLSGLAVPVMGLGLAMAVLRYRLFDIEVIIRRTTGYAILTALLALVYFGSIVLLQRLLTPFTGQSDIAVVLSTLLIAALFLPLRRRVQDVIDRRFFRRKYDAEKTLEAFAATVRNETDLDALTAELVRVIQETMEPETVSVWLMPSVRPVHSEEVYHPSVQSGHRS